MGWFSSLVDGAKKLGNKFIGTCHEVKEKARDLCDRVSTRLEEWKDKAKQKYEEVKVKVKDKIREFEVRWKHPGSVPSPPDQKAARRSKEYLDTRFRNGVEETLRNQSPTERVDTMQEVVREASEILDVKVSRVEYYEPDKEHCGTCGFFDRTDNSLHLNAYMVTSDHAELAAEQVYTIFHELIHARQWAAVTGKKDYGYSAETLLEWANNFKHYIPPTESDRDYRRQPLERDAFGFEAIIKGEISIEEFIKYNNK